MKKRKVDEINDSFAAINLAKTLKREADNSNSEDVSEEESASEDEEGTALEDNNDNNDDYGEYEVDDSSLIASPAVTAMGENNVVNFYRGTPESALLYREVTPNSTSSNVDSSHLPPTLEYNQGSDLNINSDIYFIPIVGAHPSDSGL